MTAYDFAGAVAGLTGVGLFVLAALVAVLAGLRLALVRRRAGKGRVARGALAFAGVIGLAGAGLYVAADFTPLRRALDRNAGALLGAVALVGLLAAWRAGRRRAAAPAEGAPVAAEAPPQAPASSPRRG